MLFDQQLKCLYLMIWEYGVIKKNKNIQMTLNS